MRPGNPPFHFNACSSLSILFVSCIAAFGQTTPNVKDYVSGALTMSDDAQQKEITLKHVYAASLGATIEIVLSDRPLPEQYEERAVYIDVLRKEGRFLGLVLKVRNGKIEESQAYSEISRNPRKDKKAGGFWNTDKRKQVFETDNMDESIVVATISSSLLSDESGLSDKGAYKYDASFKVKVSDAAPVYETARNDKPGEAYIAFHKAVQDEDLQAVKRLVAADYAEVFEGARARAKLSKLKSLIESFSRIHRIDVYKGGRSAKIVAENPRYEEDFKNWERARKKPGDGVAAREMPVQYADARMVLEGGQWKVYWALDWEQYNMLSKDFLPFNERVK